jgi:hypothetical protein
MAEQSIGALALKIVGPWAWYQAALKNPAAVGKTLPVHEDEPQQGYYRAKNRDKAFEPVAIFYPEGSDQLVAYRNGKEVLPDTVWTFCCRHPVTYQAYNDALAGKGWPDDDAVVAAQIQAPEPTIGDNSGNERVGETETLKDQIDAALAGMKAYETISDDKTAGKALSLRNRLNELSKDADKLRTEEKEPHLKASKAVDAKWQPLVKKAKEGADKVRDAIGSWETVKLQRRREEERKADEARHAAEEAARQQQGETAVLEAPKVDVQPDAAPSTVRASYGKAASVSVKTVVKDVTDWSALAVYMSNHPEAQDVLLKLAQRALDAGRTVPGITTEEKANVR